MALPHEKQLSYIAAPLYRLIRRERGKKGGELA